MTRLAQIDQPHRSHVSAASGLATFVNRDALIVGTIFLAALMVRWLPVVGPVIYLLVSGLIFVLHPGKLGTLVRCAPLLFIGLFAIASIFWSDAPSATAYYGAQYAVTILISCQLATLLSERGLLIGLLSAFFIFGVVNFLSGLSEGTITFYGFYSHAPFVGTMASKNTLADSSAIGLMIGITAFATALRRRYVLLALASLALIFINALLIANAQSTGAIVAAIVGCFTVIVLLGSRILSVQARFASFAAMVTGALALLATQRLWLGPLFNDLLAVSGKDSTLTGRTYIWERAQVMIDQHPLLGVGYAAFWRPGNLEAEAIWRRMLIPNKTGFNFHNTYYDWRVHLGIVGVTLAIIIVLPLAIGLLVRAVRTPTPMTIFLSALLVYQTTRMNFEGLAISQFHYATILIFTALAWAFRDNEVFAFGSSVASKPRRPTEWRSV